MACPSCYTRLRKPCHQCGRLMELSWNLCPYCATPVPGMRKDNITLEDALACCRPNPKSPSPYRPPVPTNLTPPRGYNTYMYYLPPLDPIDYLVIGHVTQDLTPNGPLLGGTASYLP